MKKVLLVSGGPLDYGGISSYMFNYLQNMDSDEVRFDFVVHGDIEGPREAEALNYGAKVFHVPNKREDFRGNAAALTKLFQSGAYPIVHAHLDGMNGYVLSLAKDAGVPIRISHCHNTQYLTRDPMRMLLHTITKKQIPKVSTHLFACSESAARFFYGEKQLQNDRVSIIKNAIDLSRYRFDAKVRKQMRDSLHISENAFVVGHVGRFEYQKNHAFLLDSFLKLKERCKDAVLVLLGDGELREKIERQVHQLGLEDSVRMPGYRQDVEKYYSAFDIFVLPSHFEGLGIALIEAQMAGLCCLASEHVPDDAAVTSCVRLPLKSDLWADALLSSVEKKQNRSMDIAPFQQAGFDIHLESKKLQRFYEELVL